VTGTGGVAGVDVDKLIVTGTADIADGNLVLSGIPLPSINFKSADLATRTSMEILTAGGVTGPFNSIELAAGTDSKWALNAGAVSYATGKVILDGSKIAWTAVDGDINRDGVVDISDLTLLSNGYGKTPAERGRAFFDWSDGDFNYDNLLDISDLTLMSNHYGTADNVVPEPMTLGLLAIGAIGLIRRRRNR
jgi:hypothetical protein